MYFVAMASINNTSAIIFAMTSVIAAVGGTSVWVLRRMKKPSILSKSSMSTSRLATVSFAAYGRSVITIHAERLHNKTHYEENTDSRKDDADRGEYLKINVKAKTVTGHLAGTHRTNTLPEGSREGVEDIHGWSEPLGESLITPARVI